MTKFLLFGTIGWPELLIIILIILILFGGKKIPELMKGLGKGVKSFKEGVKDIENDVNDSLNDDTPKGAKKSDDKKEEK